MNNSEDDEKNARIRLWWHVLGSDERNRRRDGTTGKQKSEYCMCKWVVYSTSIYVEGIYVVYIFVVIHEKVPRF